MKLQCPHCKTSFQVDENDYALLLQQVRNNEFNAEVERRMAELDRQHLEREKVSALKLEKEAERRLADKEREKGDLAKEIERLKGELNNFEANKKADLSAAEAARSQEIAQLKADRDKVLAELNARIELMSREHQHQLDNERHRHETDLINERNSRKDDLEAQKQTINNLRLLLDTQKVTAEKDLLAIKEQHTALIRAKDAEIEHYKDLKSRLSTKMLGETLEQHCQNMFNRARSQGQFLTAYFEKDNDISVGGTKGDFIFRDYMDGEEYISIMFEMKNEADTTATKHRNEDFFAKLDKDRRDKGCEYAVLVSLLESDNELYNEGIVDVSYRYDKMMVIRPQFFMAVITMLSRTALRGAQKLIALRHEVEFAKAQSVDVTKFEERRDKFVAEFSKLVSAHLKKQDDALEGIDKAIAAAEKQAENLRKIKALFETSRQKLVRANETAENDFTIKKLTYGNPTMRAKFEEARKKSE